ncbi:unnamed protein product [Prunus armeniaca]
MDRFLPTDYKQILYRMYIGCTQGNRSVSEYIEEFMRLAKRNHLIEIENQKDAINMALKAELLEKEKRQTNYCRNTMDHSENVATFPSDKGKTQHQNFGKSSKPSNLQSKSSNEGSIRSSNRVQTQNQPQKENPYAKPMTDICYRCQKPRHCSNVCPERRQANFIEDVGDDEENDEVVDDDYAGAEFAIEEGMERAMAQHFPFSLFDQK